MSGGFFRGTSADQDTRFSNKQAKLLKSQKFAPELDYLVDITKVKMDVIRPWIANRVTELLGFEDEVLINFIYGLLDGKEVNGKEVQISLTGFMEKNTGKFMKELWTLLLSAQKNESGVPQQLLDAKEEELRKKQAEMDRITNEIQKKKEKENREIEREILRKMDSAEPTINAASEPASKHMTSKGSSGHSEDDKQTHMRNGVRGQSRSSRSPFSADRLHSSPQRSPSQISKSFSNSRSYSGSRQRSRSVSRSRTPKARDHSISSNRVYRSPRQHSSRHKHPVSPPRGRSSYSRRRSRSPPHRRLLSPSRHISPSPHPRSPLPVRRRSPVRRYRSPSPVRRGRSPILVRRRRSPSPRRHRSPSPYRRRSRSPHRRRSPSPERRRSPMRRRSPPLRRGSLSPAHRRYQRSPTTPRRRSPTPKRHMSPAHAHRRSPAASHRRSSSPYGSSSPPSQRHSSSSPVRVPKEYRRSPAPSHQMSPSPNGSSSQSPVRRRSPSPVKRYPKGRGRSPVQFLKERVRTEGKRSSVPHQPSGSLRLAQRDLESQKDLCGKVPASSPSPVTSPIQSESPPITRDESASEDRGPMRQRIGQTTRSGSLSPPQRSRGRKPRHGSPETSREDEDTNPTRESNDHKSRSQKQSLHSSTSSKQKDSSVKVNHMDEYSSDKLAARCTTGTSHLSNMDSKRKGQETKSEKSCGRGVYLETPDGEKSLALCKDSDRHHKPEKLMLIEKDDHGHESGSLDSGSQESDKDRNESKEKGKSKRSHRREVASDDYSYDSEIEERKEAKRRRKEEKKLRKEEKRQRREERRRRREERRAGKLKLKDRNDANSYDDIGKDSYHTEDEETESQKKLEIELRKKAIESLKAKKGIGH